jgi:very-short-patch-repair endonuclease
MSHYPVILIPSQIQRVRSELPPKPSFPVLSQPQQPGEEPKKINNTVIGIEAVAVTIPSITMTSQGATAPGLLLFLAGVGAIAAQAWRQITTYPKRKQKHRREVTVYREKLEENDRKKSLHEREARASRSSERVIEFQYKLLLDILKRTIPHDGNGSNHPSGATEAKFENYLNKYFPNKIQTKLKVQNPDYSEGYHYTPDFAYIDERLNLHIDIEIDEPYVYHSGKPTHCLDADKDRKRNSFFNNRGWIVIRFSEEQVIRYPHSCCQTIAQTLAQVTGDRLILNRFVNIPDLQQQRQWTEVEAEEMAERRTRNKYC